MIVVTEFDCSCFIFSWSFYINVDFFKEYFLNEYLLVNIEDFLVTLPCTASPDFALVKVSYELFKETFLTVKK